MRTTGHTPAISSACCSPQAERSSGLTDAEFWRAQEPVLVKAMSSGRYPVLSSLSEDAFGTGFDHFEFGLQRILDGLEVLVASRRAATEDPAAAKPTADDPAASAPAADHPAPASGSAAPEDPA